MPLIVLWRASLQLTTATDPTTRSYLRRLMATAMDGGIPIHFLDKPELQDFPYKSHYFETCPLPFNLNTFPENFFEFEYSEAMCQFETFKNYNYCNSENFNEASLRMHFWDPILNILFRHGLRPNDEIISELNLQRFLRLNDLRKVDYTVLSRKYKFPVLLVEMAEESMNQPMNHKDFSKLTTMLTISCLEQAKILLRNKINPVKARTFGIWDGGVQCQLLVAHPVIVKGPDGSPSDDIYIVISSPDHWFLDMVLPNNVSSDRSSICHCCYGEVDVYCAPARDQIPEDLKYITDESCIRDPSFEPLPSTQSIPRENSNAQRIHQRTFQDLDPISFEKLAIFVYCIKRHIISIDNYDTSLNSNFRNINFPNVAYVPKSCSKHTSKTPIDLGRQTHFEISDKSVSRKLFNIGSDTFGVKKCLSFEFELYVNIFKNHHVIFPYVHSAEIDGKDSNYVNYSFELMKPLLGTGNFGNLFNEKPFGPHVRDEEFGPLLLDTITFALHTLNALNHLHEEFYIIHCDISPSNVMFSTLDGCWKLNDFGESLKLEDSLSRPREVGTRNFIAPESFKTGIFTKASDIFSLGSVLMLTFNLRLVYLFEIQGCTQKLEKAYNEFYSVAQKMVINDPAKRPGAKQAMSDFYEVLIRNNLQEFGISGNRRLMLQIAASINIQR